MKYKLLSENGLLFVCLESGVRLPYQTSSVVRQSVDRVCTATITAYVDEMIGTSLEKRLSVDTDNHKVIFDGAPLLNIDILSIFYHGESKMTCVEFSLEAVYGDTVEKPINANKE